MRKNDKKAVILLVIFIAALAVYFIWSSGKDDEGAVYTSIEDANLPVVYMELFGRKNELSLRFCRGQAYKCRPRRSDCAAGGSQTAC